MAARRDFLFENNKLVIRNGDLVVYESDSQHVKDIVNAFPGWFREFPTLGAKATNYINAPANEIQIFEGSIKSQLQGDGYVKMKIIVSEFTNDVQDISIYAQ